MKQVLVTGAKGQLGTSILQAGLGGYPLQLTGIDREDLDLTSDKDVRAYFRHQQVDYVINCAAYTQVDLAEQHSGAAFAMNAGLPALLAELSGKSFRIIHISTDYVFDGVSPVPYTESAIPNPLSVYGKSKLEGEQELVDRDNAMVIRSSWLYSEYGNNFARTMIRLGREKKRLDVVFDQTGSPTYAPDLARAILHIISHAEQGRFPSGIFHFSNEGVCSWFDFAWEIMQLAGLSCDVFPIRTEEYPLPAPRPEYSVLDKSKIKKYFGLTIPYWKDSLKIAIKRMC